MNLTTGVGYVCPAHLESHWVPNEAYIVPAKNGNHAVFCDTIDTTVFIGTQQECHDFLQGEIGVEHFGPGESPFVVMKHQVATGEVAFQDLRRVFPKKWLRKYRLSGRRAA